MQTTNRQCGILVSCFKADFYLHLVRGITATVRAHSETSTSGCQRTAQEAPWLDPPTMFAGPGPIFVKIVNVEFGIMFDHHM